MKPDEEETWRRALLRSRKQKDQFFREDPNSPPAHGDKEGFKGLNYFEPDPNLRIEARLQRYPTHESVVMTTSKGTRQLFNKVGYFDITVDGQRVKLQSYQSAERDDPSLFIPFRDSTSGKETYGAARYLDLEVEHDDEYVVDFNHAYNPYCAYSDDYVCPLPPQENWFALPIRAGEKKYHD